MAVGINGNFLQRSSALSRQWIEFFKRLDLVAEQHHPPGAILELRGEHIHILAPQPETAAHERGIVALVLQFHQGAGHRIPVDLAADLQLHHHLRVRLNRADTVDAAHRGHDDHIVALQQGLCGRMPHPVDLFVDLAVFFDIRIRPRHIRLRLKVIVVAHKILNRVIRKEAFHLSIKLCGKSLVRRQHQGRPLHRLDHLGHRKRLAGPGHPQQHLVPLPRLDPAHDLRNRRRLIAGRFIV